ncbi:MAG: peptidoglycan DD-metalloendopeptidase family protein [Alistipes sp.]|jgi:murein DD-endopeptidase MepM/ murein hydrolase activator NlpD|nr:peptidoglycan DD-metalloendopeptidase family protein [Alistipes sp.]
MNNFLKKYAWTVAAGVALLGGLILAAAWFIGRRGAEAIEPREPLFMYDIAYEQYELEEGEIESGQPLGKLFERFGIGAGGTYRIEQASKGIFDLTDVRAGNKYVAMLEADSAALALDSLAPPRLAHFVYEKTLTDYFVISMPAGLRSVSGGDSITVRNGSKPIVIERVTAEAVIESSMWNAIAGNGHPLALAVELEDIYGWSVDFFGIQKGDSFEVIYDQRYVDSVAVGVGRIWGASFLHGGKTYYAIPFKQDDKISYWDENGNSLKKQFLKAPLNYSRISSRFTNARRHPITRVVRPHHAVDYAAPSGTPVRAVADGTVSRRYWDSKGGGNTVWLKHARGYETGYLHLRGFGPGIAAGTRVSQGQVIGYVGSTGASTGPHLDYRIRVNGKPMDPLKIPQEPGIPIKDGNKEAFAVVRDKIMGELAGTLPEGERLMSLDSIVIPQTPLAPVNPSPVDTTKNFIDGVR